MSPLPRVGRCTQSVLWLLLPVMLCLSCTKEGQKGGRPGLNARPVAAHDGAEERVVVTTPNGPTEVSLPRSALLDTELALVVNEDDPYSVEVGDYYKTVYGLQERNVVKVRAGRPEADMSFDRFAALRRAIDSAIDPSLKAVAFAWTLPYRVGGCVAVTAAYTFNLQDCSQSGRLRPHVSQFYRRDVLDPLVELGTRPSILIAAYNVEDAKTLVSRSRQSRATFPAGVGYAVEVDDIRNSLFCGLMCGPEVDLTLDHVVDRWNSPGLLRFSLKRGAPLRDAPDVLFYFIGRERVADVTSNKYVPGALAFHPTSYGGDLLGQTQMPVLEWIKAGVSASYGTVVEPYAIPGKFPEADVLVESYFRGKTAIESYWQSVASPLEGLVVGDPLARPFGPVKVTVNDLGETALEVTSLKPGVEYEVTATSRDANSLPESVATIPSFPRIQRTRISVRPGPWREIRIFERASRPPS